MNQFRLIVLTFLIAILFIAYCQGDSPEVVKEYKLDENGRDETVKKEVKQDKNEKSEIVIEDNKEENDDDDLSESFVTVQVDEFVNNPYEYETKKLKKEEEEEEMEKEKDPKKEKEEEEEESTKKETKKKDSKETPPPKVKEEEQDIETQNKAQIMEEIETEGNENENDNEEDEQEEQEQEQEETVMETQYVEEDPSVNNNNNIEEEEGEEEVVEVEVVMDGSVIISQPSEMKNYFMENDRIVLGCFESLNNENYFNFRNASNALIGNSRDNLLNGEELKFVTVNNKQCRNVVKRFTGISMYKNDVVYCVHHRCHEYNPQYLENFKRLKHFMEDKELPIVSEYDPEKKDEYKQWNILFLVYLNNNEGETNQDIGNFLGNIAKSYIDEFVVFTSNSTQFNVETLDEPRDKNVLIFAPEFQTMYSIQEILEPQDTIDRVAVESFISQYQKGLLTPKKITQDFESMWDYDGFVVKSIPRYYYPNVLNPNRDSLVVYYKTDCPFSQE
ncbi:hypothetical protein PIROE2DRAFT_16078, partial [Piromyces sp. E2]